MLRATIKGVLAKKRGARYQCFAALADGEKFMSVVSGSCNGMITEQARGTNGFGYDPLFIPGGYSQTFAELSPYIKNLISHRAKAFQIMKDFILEHSHLI